MIEAADTIGASLGGVGERAAHWPSAVTVSSRPRPQSVSS
jgi:hypothetical protein